MKAREKARPSSHDQNWLVVKNSDDDDGDNDDYDTTLMGMVDITDCEAENPNNLILCVALLRL